MLRIARRLAAGLLLSLPFAAATAQTPAPSAVGWLRYQIPPDPARYHDMPHVVVLLGDGAGGAAPEEESAAEELDRGLGHMVAGTDQLLRRFDPRLDSIILGTPESLRRARLARAIPGWMDKPLPEEGFRILHLRNGIRQWWVLEGGSPRAELWAAFRFAALVTEDRQLPKELTEAPRLPLRTLSLQEAQPNPALLRQYARLMASVGMNGLVLPPHSDTAGAAQALRPWGIRVWAGEAAMEAERGVTLEDGVFPDAPMSGLGPMPAIHGRTALRLPLLPGGLRQPVTPLHAWQLAVSARAETAGVMATLPSAAVLPLLDQPLYQASLYAFGRFAWDPAAPRDSIVDQWARQTWGDDARIFGVAKKIVLDEEDAYAALTSPLGLPRPGTEAGPDPGSLPPDSRGRALADRSAIGADRLATAAFPQAFRERYADPAHCPPDWLLLLHRVALRLPVKGDSVVDGVYDAEFNGATLAANAADAWDETQPLLEPERWSPVHRLLDESARRAGIWRDTVAVWLLRVTGVPDRLGFAGKHSGRVEAENMTLTGYREVFTPHMEDASGGAYVACTLPDCSAVTEFHGEANAYRIEVGYFDGIRSPQRFVLRVNGAVVDTWMSTARGSDPGGASAERFLRNGVRLKPGDRVEVRSAGSLDYVDITRDPRWN